MRRARDPHILQSYYRERVPKADCSNSYHSCWWFPFPCFFVMASDLRFKLSWLKVQFELTFVYYIKRRAQSLPPSMHTDAYPSPSTSVNRLSLSSYVVLTLEKLFLMWQNTWWKHHREAKRSEGTSPSEQGDECRCSAGFIPHCSVWDHSPQDGAAHHQGGSSLLSQTSWELLRHPGMCLLGDSKCGDSHEGG